MARCVLFWSGLWVGTLLLSSCQGLEGQVVWQGAASRTFWTYRPSDAALIRVSDDFELQVFEDASCEALLQQTVEGEADSLLQEFALDCVLEKFPEVGNADALGTIRAGTRGLSYVFEVGLNSAIQLKEIVDSEGHFYPLQTRQAGVASDSTPLGPVPAENCGQLDFDFQTESLTVTSPMRGTMVRRYSLPEKIDRLMPQAVLLQEREASPWTGVPGLDFIDRSALMSVEGLLSHDSDGTESVFLPCTYSGKLKIHHEVRVPRMRVDIAPGLFVEGRQEWTLEYQENSWVDFEGDLEGQIVPTVNHDGTVAWNLSGHSSVQARGSYLYDRRQVEFFNLAGNQRQTATRITGSGRFSRALELLDFTESARLDPEGRVTLKVKTPPIEMDLVESTEDLRNGQTSSSTRHPWMFFPGAYSEISWPDETIEFTRFSESARSVRATLHSEAEVPAEWRSGLEFKLNY